MTPLLRLILPELPSSPCSTMPPASPAGLDFGLSALIMPRNAVPRTIRICLATALVFVAAIGCDSPSDRSDRDDSGAVAQQNGGEPDVTDDASDDASDEEPRTRAALDFSNTVAAVRPTVVNIYTRTDPPDQRQSDSWTPPEMVPDDRVEQSLGSGFIFDEEGLVLTNDHVVADASEIAVRLLDERVYSAEVRGTDPPTDIAVLELQEVDEALPAVELGDSDDLDVGNWVLAIGNPLGLSSTVTAGIASATGRQVMPPGGRLQFQDFIQTDASINPGSSGGPLVDLSGRVVGIATAVSSPGQGLGFAIPINMVHEILDDLLERGRVERSWLGIYIGTVPESRREQLDLPDQRGAMITRLVDGGPAQQAELQAEDVIVELDGEVIDDPYQLAWRAAVIGVGETVDAVIYREDERMTLEVTLGSLPVE